jgi:hypothetical protein
MDSDFGSDEFFDGMDKQTARELGLSAGDESTDYFLAMMRRAETEKQLKAQVKKHGMHGEGTGISISRMEIRWGAQANVTVAALVGQQVELAIMFRSCTLYSFGFSN